jgi:hypothetical protein
MLVSRQDQFFNSTSAGHMSIGKKWEENGEFMTVFQTKKRKMN